MRALVVGAARGSLGDYIRASLEVGGVRVVTAGINREALHLNALEQEDEWRMAFRAYEIDTVFCTVGINEPADDGSLNHPAFPEWLNRSFTANVTGPMNVLRWFVDHMNQEDEYGQGQFIAISSNSANIARSNSMAYCASKAALSMAVRVAARELRGHPAIVYGYELGLLQGTPMTQATEQRFGPSQTRMPGAPSGLPTRSVARQIVAQALVGGMALNGSLIRLDAGEQ